MSDLNGVSRNIHNPTPKSSFAEQASKTSKEILRSTSKEQPPQEEEQKPSIPDPDFDRKLNDPTADDRENKRWNTFRERAARQISRLEQKYPKTAETARLVARFAREEGTERLEKAATRQAASSVLPGWGNTALGVYDAWENYKDLRSFIQHVKKHPDLKPSNFSSKSKPYHELEQLKRTDKADKLEKSRWEEHQAINGKAEYNHHTGQLEYKNGRTPTEVGSQIRNEGIKIRHQERSFEEKLSLSASRHPEAMKDFRSKSEQWAREFEVNKLNNQKSNARQEYHWLLQQTEKELGKGYLDAETNPKGVLAYEKFAREDLYVKGHSAQQINKACSYGIACEVLTQEKQPIIENIKKTDTEFYESHKKIVEGRDETARYLAWKEINARLDKNVSKNLEQERAAHQARERTIDEIDR